MSEEIKARLEVLGVELETVQMLRRRAKDSPVMAIAAARREMELRAEIEQLEEEAAA